MIMWRYHEVATVLPLGEKKILKIFLDVTMNAGPLEYPWYLVLILDVSNVIVNAEESVKCFAGVGAPSGPNLGRTVR